ncbi:hypothetical protein B4Q13_20780, partial [Lacticaseibacillus rhamnosus]
MDGCQPGQRLGHWPGQRLRVPAVEVPRGVQRQCGDAPRQRTGVAVADLMHDREAWETVWPPVAHGVPLERPVELMARRKDGTATFLEVSASSWESDKRLFVTAIL